MIKWKQIHDDWFLNSVTDSDISTHRVAFERSTILGNSFIHGKCGWLHIMTDCWSLAFHWLCVSVTFWNQYSTLNKTHAFNINVITNEGSKTTFTCTHFLKDQDVLLGYIQNKFEGMNTSPHTHICWTGKSRTSLCSPLFGLEGVLGLSKTHNPFC